MKLLDLTHYLDKLLHVADFSADLSNNGLQVEAGTEVNKILFGVDASLQLFERARECGAQLVAVHHGLSWGPEPRRLTGTTAARFSALFQSGISLYAAHLPLDVHPTLGNNAQLARIIGLESATPICLWHGIAAGIAGVLRPPRTTADLIECYQREIPGGFRTFFAPRDPVSRVAVVSGAGGLEALEDAAKFGAELLITGEMDHTMYHVARECGTGVLALGHYASETTGIRALMAHIGRELPVQVEFADLPTGL